MKPAAPEMTYRTPFHATRAIKSTSYLWSDLALMPVLCDCGSQNIARRAHHCLAPALLDAFWQSRTPDSTFANRDADFKLGPLGRRIWDFFWEVFCQAKVIRERPLPGIAHAFVFWGFCAFALVTMNHIAMGFGVPFLDPSRLVSAASISGLHFFRGVVRCLNRRTGFRRFVIRPMWLGPLSYESGVIAR